MSVVVSHSTSMGLNSTIVFLLDGLPITFPTPESRSCATSEIASERELCRRKFEPAFGNMLPAQIVLYNSLLFYSILVYDPCSRSCVHCADKLKVIRELTSNLRLESTF